MIAYGEALSILRGADMLTPETVMTSQLWGHIAAETIHSGLNIPPFSNSAMDGCAVGAASIKAVRLRLSVSGSSAAGDEPAVGGTSAWEIMTGAALPSGYDSVIKIEDTEILSRGNDGRPETIRINHAPQSGQNIRRAGTDFAKDDTVITSGAAIMPLHIMALAATGAASMKVRRQPRVSILSTGKEIINDISAPLSPGQIYNSNAPYLFAALQALGGLPAFGESIPEDPKLFQRSVSNLLPQTDFIISTGAVSAGRYDFIPDALRDMGADILFHKVAIRPGKPILYARLPDGTHYLGLPGNPISAAVGLRFFGMPLIRQVTGQDPEKPISARLSHDFTKPHSLRFFAKASLRLLESGMLEASLLTGQESYKIKPLLDMNAWAEISENRHDINAGDTIRIWPLMPGAYTFES